MYIKAIKLSLNKFVPTIERRFIGVTKPNTVFRDSFTKDLHIDRDCLIKASGEVKSLLNKEDVLAKYCKEKGLVTNDVCAQFDEVASHLDEVSINRLLKLTDEGSLELYTLPSKRKIFLMNRLCNDALVKGKTKGVLNYLNNADSETYKMLKELLFLEKQGKIKANDIAEILKIRTYTEGFYNAEKLSSELVSKLRTGELSGEQIKTAQFLIDNGIPLEICNIKNISKYSKNDLSEWSKCLQTGIGKSVVPVEIFSEINRALSSLAKVNKVAPEISNIFIKDFNKSVSVLNKENLSIDKLAEMGGIELTYSRNAFKNDILKEIEKLSLNEQNQILEKFGLKIESGNKLCGLPVIIEGNSLTAKEDSINKIITKFLSSENKVILPKGFEELAPVLDNICSAVPEFKFTIGSVQHKMHKFRLAEHMLKAVQENMKNTLYKELGDVDKRILNLSTLLHDLNKTELTKDFGHALPSSNSVEAIIQRMTDFTPLEKDRIINLVRNHHWLENLSDKPEVISEYTKIFRSGNDFKMAKIFAESDLKAVNKNFYEQYGSKINSDAVKTIKDKILELQSKGRMMFTANINATQALKNGARTITVGTGNNATKNIVIDAKQMGLDKEYFSYHASSDEGLMTVISNSGPGKELCLSISIGKDGACKTFKDIDYFVIFDRLNMNNLSLVRSQNANTKYGKSYEKLFRYMNDDNGFINKFRKIYPHEISDKDYALCFREVQNLKLSEISKNKKIQEILGSEIKANDFEVALRETNKHFVSSSEHFSETVAMDLRAGAIGVKGKAEDLNYNLRKFLEDNNIPIIENIH